EVNLSAGGEALSFDGDSVVLEVLGSDLLVGDRDLGVGRRSLGVVCFVFDDSEAQTVVDTLLTVTGDGDREINLAEFNVFGRELAGDVVLESFPIGRIDITGE